MKLITTEKNTQRVYNSEGFLMHSKHTAPIAQMDRASDFESAGRGFKSSWARQVFTQYSGNRWFTEHIKPQVLTGPEILMGLKEKYRQKILLWEAIFIIDFIVLMNLPYRASIVAKYNRYVTKLNMFLNV